MVKGPFYNTKDRKETIILDNILTTKATAIKGPYIYIKSSIDTIPAYMIRETIMKVAIKLNISYKGEIIKYRIKTIR